MFDKCIPCDRIGISCVPNLMRLPFPELIRWCIKRQKHLGWSNNFLADKSKVPVGTINRIWGGDYADCKYSTIKQLLVTLIGGTEDEYHCNELIEKELRNMEQLQQQVAKLSVTLAENEMLKDKLMRIDEQHRQDIRVIKQEYQEQIAFKDHQIDTKDKQIEWMQSLIARKDH